MTDTLRLEFKSAEQRLLEQLRRWAPQTSGYGEQTVRLEYQGGQIVRVVRLNSEESVKL